MQIFGSHQRIQPLTERTAIEKPSHFDHEISPQRAFGENDFGSAPPNDIAAVPGEDSNVYPEIDVVHSRKLASCPLALRRNYERVRLVALYFEVQ